MNNGKRFKDTKTLVREIFEAHPEWNARQIYDRYLILIGDPAKKAVTLNAIQKHVEDLKVKYKSIKETGIEDIWSLANDNIPIEYIPVVMESQRHLNKGWWVSEEPNLLTVRQAKWITKLYPLMKQTAIRKGDTVDIYDETASLDNVMPWLLLLASVYSKHERISELMDIQTEVVQNRTLNSLNQKKKEYYFYKIN